MYYGRKGEPLTLLEWAARLEDLEYKRVAYTEIPPTSKYPASYLSTVWLGLDHNFFGGHPLIFETMRFESGAAGKFHNVIGFPDSEEPHDYTDQERYYTEEQASLAHKMIVQLIHEREMS